MRARETLQQRRPDLEAVCKSHSFLVTAEELRAAVEDAIVAERSRCLAVIAEEAINSLDRAILLDRVRNPR